MKSFTSFLLIIVSLSGKDLAAAISESGQVILPQQPSSLEAALSTPEPCPEWTKIEIAASEGNDIAIDPVSKKICVVGRKMVGNLRIYIACYDRCGNLWGHQSYSSSREGNGFGIVVKSSDIYATGTLYAPWPSGGTTNDTWTGKYRIDSSGLTTSWEQVFNEPKEEGGTDIAADNSGNIYVAGYKGYTAKTVGNNTELASIWVKKLTTNGNVVASGSFAPPAQAGPIYPRGITLASDGRLYLIGSLGQLGMIVKRNKWGVITGQSVGPSMKIWLGRCNSNLVFDSNFHQYFDYGIESPPLSPNTADQGNAILFKQLSSSTMFYAVGGAKLNNYSAPNLWIAYSASAVTANFTVLAQPGNSFSYEMVGEDLDLDAQGNLYVIGTLQSPNKDIVVRKYNAYPLLTPQWTKTFDSGAATDSGRGIAIVGNSLYMTGVYDGKLWLKKCPLSGCE